MRSARALLCMSLHASPCSKQVLAERPMLALSPRLARLRLLHGTGSCDHQTEASDEEWPLPGGDRRSTFGRQAEAGKQAPHNR